MMEEEAMYWIVQLVVSIENCPFVKGTSDEEEITKVPDRVILFVSEKEEEPRDKVMRSGRSNQSIIYHYTIQNQTCCIME